MLSLHLNCSLRVRDELAESTSVRFSVYSSVCKGFALNDNSKALVQHGAHLKLLAAQLLDSCLIFSRLHQSDIDQPRWC